MKTRKRKRENDENNAVTAAEKEMLEIKFIDSLKVRHKKNMMDQNLNLRLLFLMPSVIPSLQLNQFWLNFTLITSHKLFYGGPYQITHTVFDLFIAPALTSAVPRLKKKMILPKISKKVSLTKSRKFLNIVHIKSVVNA